MSTYWTDMAAKLKASIEHRGEDFMRTASLEQIEHEAGPWFSSMDINENKSIRTVMQQDATKMDFWTCQAAKLKASIEHMGEGFMSTASLDQIEKEAGSWFSSLDINEKEAIWTVMQHVYADPKATVVGRVLQ